MLPALAVDPERDRLVLFGGQVAHDYTPEIKGAIENDETWEWDGARWTQRDPPEPRPPGVASPALTFSPTRHRTLLHSLGFLVKGEVPALWQWDGQRWTEIR